jgi:hypothetical protein
MLPEVNMKNDLNTIPIVQQALFFLKEASSSNGIKITETGALGRNFVQALWDQHLKMSDEDLIFRPTRELECSEATRLRFLLSESKYIRKLKGKIYLAEKGKLVLDGNALGELYFDMLSVGINGWNWGYEDRYPDYEFIQQSADHLIKIILDSPTSRVTAQQVFDAAYSRKFKNLDTEIKEELTRCLLVRFFYRFCIPFGILKPDVTHRFLDKKPHDLFEKTEFFMSQFLRVIEENASRMTTTQPTNLSAPETASGFTTAAQKFWCNLEPRVRIRLLNNVFCFSCKSETGIGNISSSIEKGNLILKGICTKCCAPVVRLIEGE